MQYSRPMNLQEIAHRLSRIDNLKAWAAKHDIPRRTVYTVMQGTHPPRDTTIAKIRAALELDRNTAQG